MAYQAPGRHVHAGGIPGIRAALDNLASSALIITFVSESVKSLIEDSGIEQRIHFHHFFRMSRDRKFRVCRLDET